MGALLPLYTCKSCGFLSTVRPAYRKREGVLFCEGCLDRADNGSARVSGWIAEAIKASTPSDAPKWSNRP